MAHAFGSTRKPFKTASGKSAKLFSLPALTRQFPNVARLPVSLRIVLESVLRNCDGKRVTAEHVAQLANWAPNAARTDEIPFLVSRVVLQDFFVMTARSRSRLSWRSHLSSIQPSSSPASVLCAHTGRRRSYQKMVARYSSRNTSPVPPVGNAIAPNNGWRVNGRNAPS